MKINKNTILYNENYQIIVSKKELYNQLNNFSIQDNLFELFYLKLACAKYKRVLNLLGVKFELISEFYYTSKSGGKKTFKKPSLRTYYKYVFDNYCKNLKDVGDKVFVYSKDHREMLFKKYCAVRYYITPMLANTLGQKSTIDFMSILDFVAKNDTFPVTSFDNVSKFPNSLNDKVKEFDWWDHNVHY